MSTPQEVDLGFVEWVRAIGPTPQEVDLGFVGWASVPACIRGKS
jgi:hypothetical protein